MTVFLRLIFIFLKNIFLTESVPFKHIVLLFIKLLCIFKKYNNKKAILARFLSSILSPILSSCLLDAIVQFKTQAGNHLAPAAYRNSRSLFCSSDTFATLTWCFIHHVKVSCTVGVVLFFDSACTPLIKHSPFPRERGVLFAKCLAGLASCQLPSACRDKLLTFNSSIP